MHLATDRAPCAVTAGPDTPLVMNAGPADFSPANFGSGARPIRAVGLAMRGLRGAPRRSARRDVRVGR